MVMVVIECGGIMMTLFMLLLFFLVCFLFVVVVVVFRGRGGCHRWRRRGNWPLACSVPICIVRAVGVRSVKA